MTSRLGATAALLLVPLCPAMGVAQTQQSVETQGEFAASHTEQQVAEQCLDDLKTVAERLGQDQFWVSGWGSPRGYGIGSPGAAAGPAGDPAATGVTPPAGARPAASQPTAADPWSRAGAPLYGAQSPRNQIEVLYGAAYVLAIQGKQDACEIILGELADTYRHYSERLQQAGVDPAEVTTWRQEQIALAEPVRQVQGMTGFTIDDVTGTDVRNLQDENLGSISDVLLDSHSGEITYAVVARGGFLGIGRDHIMVPWNQFRATPGLNTLVLNVSEEVVEAAPTVDPDSVVDPNMMAERNQQIDRYWTEQGG